MQMVVNALRRAPAWRRGDPETSMEGVDRRDSTGRASVADLGISGDQDLAGFGRED